VIVGEVLCLFVLICLSVCFLLESVIIIIIIPVICIFVLTCRLFGRKEFAETRRGGEEGEGGEGGEREGGGT
jgi:hypothetical protein